MIAEVERDFCGSVSTGFLFICFKIYHSSNHREKCDAELIKKL